MLLARLQRQREARLAVQIDGAADDAPRHLAHQRLLAAHETEIRPAAGQRRAERLAGAPREAPPPPAPPRPCSPKKNQTPPPRGAGAAPSGWPSPTAMSTPEN